MTSNHILVAVGDALTTCLLTESLLTRGFCVDVVSNSRHAMDKIAGQEYRAVLVDDHMCDVSGRRLYEEIAGVCPDRTDRVVVLVDEHLNKGAARFFAESGRPWLTKPLCMEELDKLMTDNGSPLT